MEKVFITIAGLIGAGKTTLADKLGQSMHLPVYHEPVFDGTRLSDFYADMTTNGFSFQIYLLNKRFEQHQQIIWAKEGAIQDRTIYEDEIFAKMLVAQNKIRPEDYEVYKQTSQNMFNFMRRPTLILYLHVTPQVAYNRIQERGRACESGITLEYLTDLYNGYEKFMQEISKVIPVYRIDWTFFKNEDDVTSAIIKAYNEQGMISLILS